MFSSPYSPFFTSGLLSEPLVHLPEAPAAPRRGSLPDTSSQSRAGSSDHASAFYYSMQPSRDEQEFRSFLSLDLAESQSMRSASLRRKISAFKFPRIPEAAPPPLPEQSPRPTSSLRLRFSRDSLRSFPSPKPAPSITLPELPQPSSPLTSAPPRLPSLPTLPALELAIPPAPVPRQNKTRVSVTSKITTSTVSTRYRRTNRSEALAALEGRTKSAPAHVHARQPSQRDFMSLSDDEDDEDDDFRSLKFGDVLNPFMEPEDIVLPTRLSPQKPSPTRSSVLAPKNGTRSKRRPSKDWFPLNSFIDLQNDDDSSNWSWRSFIEVAHVS